VVRNGAPARHNILHQLEMHPAALSSATTRVAVSLRQI